MALNEENGGGGIPATMLVGPAAMGGGNAMPYPVPMYGMGGGMGNNMGGDGAWWLILVIIVIAALGGGWGNNNSGGGGFGGGAPIVISDNGGGGGVQRGFDQAAIMSGIGGIQAGISGLSTQLCGCCGDMQMALANGFAGVNSNLSNGFAQAEIANNARQIADMQQNFAAQMATMQGFTNVNSGISDLRYTEATEACATRNQATQNTRDIIDAINNRAQGIENKLCQLELDGYKRENAQLRSDLSDARNAARDVAQTAQIQRGQVAEVDALYQRLRDCPVPSQPVFGMTPIFTCPNNNNNGCGCGCGAA